MMTSAITAGGMRRPQNAQTNWTETILTFVKWCQGRSDIRSNLSVIANYFHAEAAGLSRWNCGNKSLRVAGIVNPHSDYSYPGKHSGLADVVCGSLVDSIKPGAGILLSEILDGQPVMDAALKQYLFRHDLADIGIICIAANGQTRDFIELHFRSDKLRNWGSVNQLEAPSLADIFSGRKQGLMLSALLHGSRQISVAKRTSFSEDLLSDHNPANFTRSEWKICALIASGLSRDGIAKELSIKASTIQTHLRNIYAKTGYDTFHALALHLVSPAERMHLALDTHMVAA